MSTNFNDYKPNYLKIEALGTNDSAINNMTISFRCANYYPSVTLINDNPTLGNITGGGVYFTGSNVTISATPNTNYTFVGWYDTLNNLVSTESSYTFAMPSNDVTYHAKFTTLSKGATTQFGTYPQSKVTDATLISTLNTAAGTLPTSSNSEAWTDYGYYISGSVASYMWYIDVPNSGNLYRGVYFTSYRPYRIDLASSTYDSWQDDHDYYTNETYWFKFEPISWKVLDIVGGKAFLLAVLALDAQDFHYSTDDRSINGATVHANNYEHSHIRAWLNDTFYNTAFTTTEKIMIDTTNVDNSVSSTGYATNKHACPNTNDKVFLLSTTEVSNANYGFTSNSKRRKWQSDYALSQGVHKDNTSNTSMWWVRSPNDYYTHWARTVYHDGHLNVDDGIVPALWINLNSNGQRTFGNVEKASTIQFGTYPQSKVTDATLISTLNTAAGTLPTSGNNRAWTDYGYYVNSNVSSYMWYIDVPNSGNLYRGVYFTGYRPFSTSYSSSSGDSSQDEHGYYKNETYWFKYEPISWKVLDIAGGKAFLLADLAIDAQDYYHSKFPRDINGTTVYPNNYEHSYIRAWLNDTFYNTAFTTMEKIMIDNTNVDNSVSSTGYDPNPYVCDSTNDKVFLLSYSEVTNTNYGFDAYHLSTDINRKKSPSDYALSQGVNRIADSNSSYYWLRSPHSGNYENARRVRADGMAAAYNIVTAASYGVVPALWIIL